MFRFKNLPPLGAAGALEIRPHMDNRPPVRPHRRYLLTLWDYQQFSRRRQKFIDFQIFCLAGKRL
jgi:hypothetical protein